MYNRLPRFQFFFRKFDLLKAAIELLYLKNTKSADVKLFEEKLKEKFKIKNVHTTSSFRIGLFHSLCALNLKKGDEVLLSPITIPETVNALLILGLVPVFVDIEQEYHFIDTNDLKRKISPKSKAVIVTYLSGISPEIKILKNIVSQNNLLLIEDFSQNFGAKSEGDYHGTVSDVAIGSLSCGKIISSTVGGVVFTNNDEISNNIQKLIERDRKEPNKMVLFYYLFYATKVTLGTTRVVYILLTHFYLKIKLMLSGKKVLDFEHDPYHPLNIFYTYRPKLREKFPENYFTFFGDWQARVALRMLVDFEEGLDKRRKLASHFIENLSPDSKKHIPLGLLKVEECSYYHFPIKCFGKIEEMRAYFFDYGIDSGGYGLNLCTEEEVFKDYSTKLEGAICVKHDTMYIPINEVYTFKHMRYMAELLNKYSNKS